MILTVITLYLLIMTSFIVWALQTDKDIDFAVIDGFFIGGLYDKDENEVQYLHTVQIIFVVLSISILWETDK